MQIEGVPNSAFPTRRSKILFLRLALDAGQPVDRNELSRLLWPDDYLDAARPRLRKEIARAKQAIAPYSDAIEGDRDRLWLTQEAEVDLAVFKQHLVALERGTDDGKDRIDFLRAARAEELGEGFDEDWVTALRESLIARQVAALLQVADRALAAGSGEEALTLARRAAELNPLNEEVYIRLLQGLRAQGRHAEVRQEYDRIRRLFLSRVGIGPSPRLAELAEVGSGSEALGRRVLESPRPRAALAPILGRDSELQFVVRWVEEDQGRLLTLLGPGGIGKTRLAQEVHRFIYEPLNGRVWMVELADVVTADRIAPLIVESLGLRPSAEDPLIAVSRALGDEPAIFLLDNFEQLVDQGAHVVRRLLEENPSLRVIITSRRRLHLPGEQDLPIGPLDGESENSAGVRLFLDRATSGVAADPAQLSQLVRALDGNPLAISLAASRTSAYSVAELVARLPHEFDLLGTREPGGDPRHRHLRSAIAWSFDSLTPQQQRFLKDLTVFHGWWTIDDAKEFLEEPRAGALLEELVEHAFVHAQETPEGKQFRLLVTIRAFLSELLTDAESETLERKNAEGWVRMADSLGHQMRFEGNLVAYALLARRMEDVQAALRWLKETDPDSAVVLLGQFWRYWSVRGRQLDLMPWGEFLLDPSLQPSWSLTEALLGLGRCACESCELTLALQLFARNEAVCEMANRPWMALMNRENMVDVYFRQGRFVLAAEHLESLLERMQASPHRHDRAWHMAITFDDLGVAYTALGRFEEAEAMFREALPGLSTRGDAIPYAYLLQHWGDLDRARGDLTSATLRYQEAGEIFDRFGTSVGIRAVQIGLTWVALAKGELEEAERHLDEAERAALAVDDVLGMAHVHFARGVLASYREDFVRSEEELTRARLLFERLGDRRSIDECRRLVAEPPAKPSR